MTDQTNETAPADDEAARTIRMPWGVNAFESTFTIRTEWGFQTGGGSCTTRLGNATVALRVDGDDRDLLPRHVRLIVSAGTESWGERRGDTVRRNGRDVGWMATLKLDPGTGKALELPQVHLEDAGAARDKRDIFSFAPSVEDAALKMEVAVEATTLAHGWEEAMPGYVAAFYARAMREYRDDLARRAAEAEARLKEILEQARMADLLAQDALEGTPIHVGAAEGE